MRKLSIIIIIAFCLIFVPARFADEGMWTFDNPPLKQWKEKYGFEPSREWLDHVRLSTVRLSEGAGGGTGSFISADGLVFTNQHVGAGQVAKLSTGGRDLVKEGFYARTREEELKCPDLEVNVMVSYEDVTKRVQGAAKSEGSDKDAAAQRKAEMAAIEKDESAKTGLKCEVVTLYNGGEYWLYRFKRYTDVRLVFSPEEQIAYFGGDYDNFTFPRHDLRHHLLPRLRRGAAREDRTLFEMGVALFRRGCQRGRAGDRARISRLDRAFIDRRANPLSPRCRKSVADAGVDFAQRGVEALLDSRR